MSQHMSMEERRALVARVEAAGMKGNEICVCRHRYDEHGEDGACTYVSSGLPYDEPIQWCRCQSFREKVST